jgi:hypothetical protein
MKTEAIIFDMDGTLCDVESIRYLVDPGDPGFTGETVQTVPPGISELPSICNGRESLSTRRTCPGQAHGGRGGGSTDGYPRARGAWPRPRGWASLGQAATCSGDNPGTGFAFTTCSSAGLCLSRVGFGRLARIGAACSAAVAR